MYTIELVRGMGWDAPVIETHPVKSGIHIGDVERLAQSLLNGARSGTRRNSPTNYRILDMLGRCVRASVTGKPNRSFTRYAGRTAWPAGAALPR